MTKAAALRGDLDDWEKRNRTGHLLQGAPPQTGCCGLGAHGRQIIIRQQRCQEQQRADPPNSMGAGHRSATSGNQIPDASLMLTIDWIQGVEPLQARRIVWIAAAAFALATASTAASAAPFAKHLTTEPVTIQVKGGHGHGHGGWHGGGRHRGWHGNRGLHRGWYIGRHRGWSHSRHRHHW